MFAFARRRIGRDAASVLVDAMVSGIHAGDIRRLSIGATFPRLPEMVQAHGSLFRAWLARRRKSATGGVPAGPAARLNSFRDGMQVMTDALARSLGDRLRLGCGVAAISDMGKTTAKYRKMLIESRSNEKALLKEVEQLHDIDNSESSGDGGRNNGRTDSWQRKEQRLVIL